MREDEWLAQVSAILPEAMDEEAQFPAMPVVALFGAYDAGKSTLVKRLLVEAEAPVPSWLTVSARRETFEMNDVEAFGCILRDTPGLAAGSAAHEEAALQAVLESDVMLLVMPPQLITGDKDVILPILSGTVYRKKGLPWARSLLVVITQLDKRADPVDDPAGYQAYATLKRTEWGKLIEANDLPLSDTPVFTVSADPEGYVGNDIAPVPASYMDGCREWDGIDALVSALAELPEQFGELRRMARMRRLCSKLTSTVAALDAELLGNQQVLAEAERQQKQIDNLVAEEKFVRESSQAELRRRIEEEISSFFSSRGKDAAILRDRLQGCARDWLADQSAKLDRLMRENGAQAERAEAARWQIDDWVEPATATRKAGAKPQIQTKAEKAFRELMDLRKITEFDGKSAKDYAAISDMLGKKITDLQAKLDQSKETAAPGIKKAIGTFTKKKEATDNMLSSAKTHEQMIALAPIAMEGVSALMSWWADREHAKASAAEREERQRAFAAYGRKAAADAWEHIRPAYDDFSAGLELQATMLADVVQEATRSARQIASSRNDIQHLLADVPGGTAASREAEHVA